MDVNRVQPKIKGVMSWFRIPEPAPCPLVSLLPQHMIRWSTQKKLPGFKIALDIKFRAWRQLRLLGMYCMYPDSIMSKSSRVGGS